MTDQSVRWLGGRQAVGMLLAIVVVLAYGSSFRNEWTYDDYYVIVANQALRSLSALFAEGVSWRCLRDVSLFIDNKLWGTAPAGYHLQQLLLHWANAWLIYIFCRQLGCQYWSALCGSIFFIVHPLQVETVANISHRKESLALLFVLILLLGYRAACRTESLRRWVLLTLSALAYGCAILANETAVSAILLLIIYEALFLLPAERLLLRYPKSLLLCGFLCGGAGWWYLQARFPLEDQILKVFLKNAYYATPAYLPLLLGCLQVVALYAGKLLLPLNLAPEYLVGFSASFWQPLAVAGLLISTGIVVVAWRSRIKKPPMAFGFALFIILYLPIANFYPVAYMMADRYLYMPLAGVALVLASFGTAVPPRPSFRIAVLAGLALLTGLTIRQNAVWRSEHTLWRHAVQVNPRSSWVQGAAAKSYLRQGDLDSAREHATLAITIDRKNAGAYLTLARAEERSGNLPAAIGHYETFVLLGAQEFPRETAEVTTYLPYVRRRVAQSP
jgi:tetratricopeptide (TPR) repeat protein